MDSRRNDRVIIAVLLLAALLPFVHTLTFGYVMDDTTAIRANPDVQGWGSLLKVWARPYYGSRDSGLYRPLLMTVFAFLWNAGGQWALAFHLLSVALHMTVTVLVWRLLTPTMERWPATLAALWFAAHPVHIEAVANIANSAEVFVAFWTCVLALWLKRLDARPDPISWTDATVAGAMYLAAFLTKESGAVAPLLATLWVWGSRPRATPVIQPSSRERIDRWRRVVVACAVAAVIVFVARRMVLGGALAQDSIASPGMYELSTAGRIVAMLALGPTILRLLIWPGPPNPHYGPTMLNVPGAPFWAAATALTVLVALYFCVRLARRGDRGPLTAIAWIGLAFLPASNLLVATGQILSERTLYVPSIGVAMLVGLLLDGVWLRATASESWQPIRGAAAALMAGIVITFGVRSAIGSLVWRDHATLFKQMIASDNGGYRGYWLSGLEARRNGRKDAAIALFDRAYSLYPRDPALLMDYTITLYEEHDYRRAAPLMRQLMTWPRMRKDPYWAAMYLDILGRAFGTDSVIVAGERLMAETPTAKTALFVGYAHELRGDVRSATRIYQQGLQLSPGDSALTMRLREAQHVR